QELDRRIEGVSARGGERMNAIEEQLVALRDELSHLRQLQEPLLEDVNARARAEVPEIPSAEQAEVPAAEPAEFPAAQPAEAPSEEQAEVPAAQPADAESPTEG